MNRRQWLKKTLCGALALPFLRGSAKSEEKTITSTLPDYKAEISGMLKRGELPKARTDEEMGSIGTRKSSAVKTNDTSFSYSACNNNGVTKLLDVRYRGFILVDTLNGDYGCVITIGLFGDEENNYCYLSIGYDGLLEMCLVRAGRSKRYSSGRYVTPGKWYKVNFWFENGNVRWIVYSVDDDTFKELTS